MEKTKICFEDMFESPDEGNRLDHLFESTFAVAQEAVKLNGELDGIFATLKSKSVTQNSQEKSFVEDTLELLSQSQTKRLLDDYLLLKKENKSLMEEMSLAQHSVISVSTKKNWQFWREDREGLGKRIGELNQRIKENQRLLESVKRSFRKLIHDAIPEFTDSQADSLLLCADAPELINLIGMTQNMKKICECLSNQLLKDQAAVDPDLLKKYAAMHWLMLKAYKLCLDKTIAKIKGTLIPRVKQVKEEATQLTNTAENLTANSNKYYRQISHPIC